MNRDGAVLQRSLVRPQHEVGFKLKSLSVIVWGCPSWLCGLTLRSREWNDSDGKVLKVCC